MVFVDCVSPPLSPALPLDYDCTKTYMHETLVQTCRLHNEETNCSPTFVFTFIEMRVEASTGMVDAQSTTYL